MTDAAAAPAPADSGTSASQPSSTSIEAVFAKMQSDKVAAAQAAQPPEAAASEPAPPADTPSDEADSGSEAEAVEEIGSDEPLEEAAPEDTAEPEEDGEDLLYTVKIDGQQKQVSLSELISGYQLGSASRARMDQAAAQKRAAEEQLKAVESKQAEIAQARAAYEQQAQRYAQVVDKLAANLEPEAKRWESVDWDALEQDDPVQASTQWRKYQSFKERQQAVSAEQARVQREHAQETAKRIEEARTSLKTEIQTLFPQWSDPAVQQRDLDEMAAYARDSGISDQELSGWLRGRDWKILHDATLFRRQQRARAAAKEPVPQPRTSPPPPTVRMVRPEAPRPNPARTARATEVAGLKNTAMKSGNLGDVFALMRAQQANKTTRRS